MIVYLLSIGEEGRRPDILELYSIYKEPLLKITIKQLQDVEDPNYIADAQDIVQNVFVKTVRYINDFPDSSKREHQAYLYAMLQNEIYRFLVEYKKLKNESYELGDPIDDDDFIEALEIKERYREVVDAIYALEERYSTVLLFKYAKNFSVKRIAQVLGVDRSVVYARLRKGRVLLLEELKRKEEDQ